MRRIFRDFLYFNWKRRQKKNICEEQKSLQWISRLLLQRSKNRRRTGISCGLYISALISLTSRVALWRGFPSTVLSWDDNGCGCCFPVHSNLNQLVENHFVCVQQFPFSLSEQKCFVLAYCVQYRMLFLWIVCSMVGSMD